VPPGESEDNARAFLEQIDSIKPTDVSLVRTDAFASEDDFNGLAAELLIEVGSFICVAGNLTPAKTRRWDRNQAVLGGHLVRLYKLISALLDQICQHRREITFIIARLAFECIVNIRFLIKFGNAATYDSYVRYSLKQEKRLYERISKEIEERRGEKLPIEERMLGSIDKAVKASGLSIEDLSPSQSEELGRQESIRASRCGWAGRNLCWHVWWSIFINSRQLDGSARISVGESPRRGQFFPGLRMAQSPPANRPDCRVSGGGGNPRILCICGRRAN
jgi:hypothetical protein